MNERPGVVRTLARRLHTDERGLVIGFFVRLILVMAFVGLVVAEGGQVLVAQIRAQSAARGAATAAADAWAIHKDMASATAAATEAAQKVDAGAKVEHLQFDAQGIATVRIRETAHTILVQHIGFLRRLRTQRATDTQGRSP